MLKISSNRKDSIAVDFDGVIHGYSGGWKDGSIYDPPVPGVREALKKLQEKFRIVIFSTRGHDRTIKGEKQKNQRTEMREYMEKHNDIDIIPKPFNHNIMLGILRKAVCYVD